MSGTDYAFVDGMQAGEDARRRMASLIFSTSYLEYCSAANKLGVPCVELQRRQNIDPYLRHIRVLHASDERFAGFFNAATMAEFAGVRNVCHYRDDMRALDDAYEAFVARHTLPSDYFVASLAIEPRDRGQGLFHRVFDEIVEAARRARSGRVVLTVWASSPSLTLYRKKGMRVVATFDDAYELFFDQLQLLELALQDPGRPALQPGDAT